MGVAEGTKAAMIEYTAGDIRLTAEEFCDLCAELWARPIPPEAAENALAHTLNITARDRGRLIGCTRILTDHALIAVIPDILVRSAYSQTGVGEKLLKLAYEVAPTHVVWPGTQPMDDAGMMLDGWKRAYRAYAKRKPSVSP